MFSFDTIGKRRRYTSGKFSLKHLADEDSEYGPDWEAFTVRFRWKYVQKRREYRLPGLKVIRLWVGHPSILLAKLQQVPVLGRLHGLKRPQRCEGMQEKKCVWTKRWQESIFFTEFVIDWETFIPHWSTKLTNQQSLLAVTHLLLVSGRTMLAFSMYRQ